MSTTNYNIIWFDDGGIFTLVDGNGERVTISDAEVVSDGYGIIYVNDHIAEAIETGERYAITPRKLSELLGVI